MKINVKPKSYFFKRVGKNKQNISVKENTEPFILIPTYAEEKSTTFKLFKIWLNTCLNSPHLPVRTEFDELWCSRVPTLSRLLDKNNIPSQYENHVLGSYHEQTILFKNLLDRTVFRLTYMRMNNTNLLDPDYVSARLNKTYLPDMLMASTITETDLFFCIRASDKTQYKLI